MKSEDGTVEYKCDSKKFKFTKYGNEYKLDSNFSWIQKAFDELCAMTGVAPVVAPVVAGGETVPWTAVEKKHIIAFQRWWWHFVETVDPEPGTDVEDVCKTKFKSALCGGKPCILDQAVDGKLGASTQILMDNTVNRSNFEKWWNTGKNAVEYSTLPYKCTSAEKGYVNPDKNPDKNPVEKPIVGGGGGGGAPFGGQYADMV
jgi:hypothetical protein